MKDHILNCIGNSMILCIFDHWLIKKTTYTVWTSCEAEQITISKANIWKSAKNQLHGGTMKDISIILILKGGNQYIFYHECNCGYKIKSLPVQNTKQYSFCKYNTL